MKKTILLTAVSLLAIETVYAIPGRDQLGDESLTTVSLRSTRAPRKTSEKAFSEGFEYRWQMKTNGTLGHSVRRTTEETPYVDLRALLRTNPAMPEDQQYSVKFSEEDIGQILDLYRTGKLQLSWDQNGLACQQYCVHPLDEFHTLAVTSPKGKTYYKQQRWDGEIGNSPVRDIFADSRSQLEYRFDPDSQQWLVEGRKGSPRFSKRENAVKVLKRLGLKYELKDRARGEYSSEPLYSFTDPATRWELDEVERVKDAAYKPSLWKTLPMGWLALTSGGLIEALRHGLTASALQPSQAEEAKPSDHSGTIQRASYSVSSLTELVARSAPYAVTPLLLSMLSSRKSGLRSPLGILATFGLGELGSVAAQYTSDDQPEDGYVPPMGPVFQINDNKELGNDVAPCAITLSGEKALVMWDGVNEVSNQIVAVAAIININGHNITTTHFSINNGTSYSDTPYGSVLPGENAFLVWNNGPLIEGQVINAVGQNVTPSFPISDQYPYPIFPDVPVVTTLKNKNVLVIWPSTNQDTYEGFGIQGRIMQGPNPVTEEFTINSDNALTYASLSLTTLLNDNVFIIWKDTDYNSNYRILGNIVNNKGFNITHSPIVIDSVKNNDNPAVSALLNGNVFIAWAKESPTYIWNIYGYIMNEIGKPISPKPFRINMNEVNAKSLSLASSTLSSGNVFIAWKNEIGMLGSILNEDGTKLIADFQINNDLTSSNPKITPLQNESALVVWVHESYPLNTYGRIVYANQTQSE